VCGGNHKLLGMITLYDLLTCETAASKAEAAAAPSVKAM
jgi:hypothetical protein